MLLQISADVVAQRVPLCSGAFCNCSFVRTSVACLALSGLRSSSGGGDSFPSVHPNCIPMFSPISLVLVLVPRVERTSFGTSSPFSLACVSCGRFRAVARFGLICLALIYLIKCRVPLLLPVRVLLWQHPMVSMPTRPRPFDLHVRRKVCARST